MPPKKALALGAAL
jgi:hypothetical protein